VADAERVFGYRALRIARRPRAAFVAFLRGLDAAALEAPHTTGVDDPQHPRHRLRHGRPRATSPGRHPPVASRLKPGLPAPGPSCYTRGRGSARTTKEDAMPVDKSAIGRTGEPVTMHVERGKIQEFARAIKDDDPLYYDEGHAAKEAGGIMPPVTFLQTVAHWDDGRGRPRLPFDLKRVLHGEQEFEFLAPIHAGDVLTAVSRIVDVYEKPGKRGGSMTFAVTETEYRNAQGALVARARAVGIETGQVVKD
jgi:acyl dehydratase